MVLPEQLSEALAGASEMLDAAFLQHPMFNRMSDHESGSEHHQSDVPMLAVCTICNLPHRLHPSNQCSTAVFARWSDLVLIKRRAIQSAGCMPKQAWKLACKKSRFDNNAQHEHPYI